MQKPQTRLRVVCILLVSIQSIFWLSTHIFAQEVHKSQRWALLIGIGRYANLPDLHGPENDVEILAYALKARYGFKKDHILTLRDEEATRDRIIQEFEALIKRTNQSDIVYIHYSGHGSQVKDLNGDEFEDHKDETLVPHDGRMPDVPDLTDDEFNDILHRIPAQRVIVSIDACHSGSATRGINIQARSVPPDIRLQLYMKTQRFTRGAHIIASPHSVVFSSSAPDERALDGRIAGRYHGYFSYAVFHSLMSVPIDSPSQRIFEGVKSELNVIKHLLHRRTFPAPQLEVSESIKGKSLFPRLMEPASIEESTGGAQEIFHRVLVKRLGDSMVALESARYFGGLPSSVWELLPTEASNTKMVPDRIFATVVDVKGMDALAEVPDAQGITLDRVRARLVRPAMPPSRLSLMLRDLQNKLSSHSRKIQEMFTRLAEPAEDDVYEGFLVDVRARNVNIYSADGQEKVETLSFHDLENLLAELKSFLNRSLSSVKIKELLNPNSSIHIKARLMNVLDEALQHEKYLFDPTLYVRHPNESANETNSLQVEIWVNKPSFLTIINVDSKGKSKVLFPSPFQSRSYYPNGFIPGQEKVILPDSFVTSNRAGFAWDIGPPIGPETLYILASSDKNTAERIREFVSDDSGDSERPLRGSSIGKCSTYAKLQNFLYPNLPLNMKQPCRNFDLKSAILRQSRGNSKAEKNSSKASDYVGDWNAVSLRFWVEDLH